MTFSQFVQWFQRNFTGAGVPALIRDLGCWWPACTSVDAPALVAYRQCPADIKECLALVKNVSATNNAHVHVELQNACGISPSPVNPINGNPANAAKAPPASSQVAGIIVVLMIAVVISVILLACIPAVKRA